MRFSSRARERHLPYIAIMRSDARAPAAAVLPTERWVQSLPSPAGVGYLHRHLKRTALITESSADVLSHGGAHALGLRDVFLANKAGTQLNSAEIGIEGWVGNVRTSVAVSASRKPAVSNSTRSRGSWPSKVTGPEGAFWGRTCRSIAARTRRKRVLLALGWAEMAAFLAECPRVSNAARQILVFRVLNLMRADAAD
jgi:hypothetical protein